MYTVWIFRYLWIEMRINRPSFFHPSVLTCLLIPLQYLALSAQNPFAPSTALEKITTEQGLSSNEVYEVLQDKQGFIWFLATNGLNRYDGYSFRIYNYDPTDSNSFSSGYFYALEEDAKGLLWFNSESQGIYSFNPATEKFRHYRHHTQNKNSLADDLTQGLVLDKSGNVWIATQSGLDKLNPGTNTITHFTHQHFDPTSISNNFITSIAIDEDDNLWMTSASPGIDYFNTHTGKLISHFNFGSSSSPAEDWQNHPYGAHVGKNGNVWVGSRSDGLVCYNTRTGKQTLIRHNPNDPYSLSGNGVFNVYEDHAGNLWIATDADDGTLDFFNTAEGKSYHQRLDDMTHIDILEDRSHKIWISTVNGVYSCNPKHKLFESYGHDPKNPHSISSNYISSFLCSRAGTFYVASNGVDYFDTTAGTFIHHKLFDKSESGSDNNLVWHLYEDSKQMVWFSTILGLASYDPVTKNQKWYFHDEQDSTSLSATSCTGIYEDSKGRYWVTTWGGGFASFNPVTGKFHTYKVSDGRNSISTNSTAGIFEDSHGTLYIGNWNGGLINFNPETEEFKIARHNAAQPGSLSSDITHFFFEGKNGLLWFCTMGGGVNVYNPSDGKFRSFTTKDGLCSNFVTAMTSDNNGNLWVGTQNGISCFLPPDDPFAATTSIRFRNYNRSDGLPDNKMAMSAAYKQPDGKLYFGTEYSGMFCFYPHNLHDNTFLAPVYITEFSLFNHRVKPGDKLNLLSAPLEQTKEIKLNYDQDKITFTFAVLNYIHPEKNRYAYKLDGFDKDWNYASAAERTANYTNLDAGEYILHVKGSNNDGVWNPKEALLKLIISPPYWETWWFRLAVAATLALGIYALYRFRLNHYLRLQHIRNKIAHDLHDDIGSTLNSISIFSEVAQQEPSKQKEALEMIGESSRKVIEAMSDIVWTINPGNDTFEKIIDRMRSFSFNLFRARNIEHTFKAGEDLSDLKLTIEDRRNLFLIFKEAVNNLVKYSGASRVKIQMNRAGNGVILTIADNGKGFDTAKDFNGNGINNMRARAREMHASIQITSVHNEGTTVELKFKTS